MFSYDPPYTVLIYPSIFGSYDAEHATRLTSTHNDYTFFILYSKLFKNEITVISLLMSALQAQQQQQQPTF
jgi:hypothetical protein